MLGAVRRARRALRGALVHDRGAGPHAPGIFWLGKIPATSQAWELRLLVVTTFAPPAGSVTDILPPS